MLIHLVRHAHAGDRTRWEGDDALRPLTAKGAAQAEEICRALRAEEVDTVWSSRSLRCLQTIAPLADALGIQVVEVDDLYEGATGGAALDVLVEGALNGQRIVACSHGDVIPALVRAAIGRGADLHGPAALKKGARYVLRMGDEHVSDIDHVPVPVVDV